MLMTDDCGSFLLFIPSFSSSTIKCDPLVFIWCLCVWRETMFCWFYQLLLVFIPSAEHFQREDSEYMYSYFRSTLQIQLSTRFPSVNGWGVLPYLRCRLLSLVSSRMSPRWALQAVGQHWCHGRGRSSLRVAAGLCPAEKVPEPDAHLFKLKKNQSRLS